MGLAEELEQYPPRPTARAECLPGGHNAVRPCPYVSCQWHLAVDVSEDNGNIKLNFPDLEPWELTETCALDVAGRGGTSTTSDGATLEEVARAMNITRERVRQIEAKALEKLPRRVKDLAEVLIDDVAHDTTRPRSQRGARMRIDYASEPQRQPAPARAAHLPGPDGVTAAVETFWCATLGAAVTGALCTRRHLGRERQTENRSAPLYPVCARCSDGVAVAARLGAVAGAPVSGRRLPVIQAAPPPLARVEWFGEAAPANDPPPAAIEETAVPTPTAPAPPASTEAKVIDLQRLVGQLAHERDQLRGEVEGLTTDLRVAQRDASTSSAAAVRYLDERDEARALLAEALTVGLAAVEQARTLERTWEREAVDNGDRLLVVEAERDQLLRDRAREHQEHPAPPPPASAPLDEALLRRIATQAARQAVRATRDDARLRALADSAGGVDALVRLVAGAARLLGGLTS